MFLDEMHWWMWIALIYLCLVGIRAIQTGGICIRTFSTIPVIFILSKYHILFYSSLHVWGIYFVFLVISAIFGYMMAAKEEIKFAEKSHDIQIPGSYSVLISTIVFFTIKYPLGYLLHSLNSNIPIPCIYRDIAIIGLFAGFFFGKFIVYLYKVNK